MTQPQPKTETLPSIPSHLAYRSLLAQWLETARSTGTHVDIFLATGVRLSGRIENFDEDTIYFSRTPRRQRTESSSLLRFVLVNIATVVSFQAPGMVD